MDHSIRGTGDVHLPQVGQTGAQEPATILPYSLRDGVQANMQEMSAFLNTHLGIQIANLGGSLAATIERAEMLVRTAVGAIELSFPFLGTGTASETARDDIQPETESTPSIDESSRRRRRGGVTVEVASLSPEWQRQVTGISASSKETAIGTLRDDIQQNPRQLLDTLMEKFSNKEFVDRLQINFIGEEGLDSSGLSRDFVSGLFSALAEKLSFKEYHNGLFRPELQHGQSLDPADEKTYRDIGRLLMFCLNAVDSYPIGMIFDRGVYAAIQAFPDEMLGRDFGAVAENIEKENFDTLLSIYEKMHAHDEEAKRPIERMKRYLTSWDEHTSDTVIETAYDLVESDLPQELQGITDIAELKKHGDSIQKALRAYCMREFLTLKLSFPHAMAQGMRGAEFQSPNSWENIKKMDTDKLEETIQGVVTVEKILKKLAFREVSNDKQEWVKNWIKSCDEKTLKRFLYMLTGANSLGRKDLVIGNTSSEGLAFHTCFNMLDFPFHGVDSEQEFKSIIEASLTGKAGYNIA